MTPVELLMARRSAKAGSKSSDGAHLALVLEGGGMRGVISIGLAAAFEDAGLTDCFDSIHGSSAGAFAAAYFASGHSERGGSIYYEDINNERFIDLRRPLIGRPVMNLDYLVDEVMVDRKPLDADRVYDRPGYLNVVLTDAQTGQPRVFSDFSGPADLRECLKASATIPLIAGSHNTYRGKPFVDGGIVQQIALASALDAGATHVVVLMTRKIHQLFRRPKSLPRTFELFALSLFYPRGVVEAYARRAGRINDTTTTILAGKTNTGTQIAYFAPPEGAPSLSRLTRDGEQLKEAFDASRRSVLEQLVGSVDTKSVSP